MLNLLVLDGLSETLFCSKEHFGFLVTNFFVVKMRIWALGLKMNILVVGDWLYTLTHVSQLLTLHFIHSHSTLLHSLSLLSRCVVNCNFCWCLVFPLHPPTLLQVYWWLHGHGNALSQPWKAPKTKDPRWSPWGWSIAFTHPCACVSSLLGIPKVKCSSSCNKPSVSASC